MITIKFLFQEYLEMTGVPQVDEGFEWSNEALLPVVSSDGAPTFEHARSVAPPPGASSTGGSKGWAFREFRESPVGLWGVSSMIMLDR